MKRTQKLGTVALLAFGMAVASPLARAVSLHFTDVVETPDALSFSFSGEGLQLIQGPPGLAYWVIGWAGGSSFDRDKGLYGTEMVSRHGDEGSLVGLGSGSFIDNGGGGFTLIFQAVVPFGSSSHSQATVSHGASLDHYEFMITVEAPLDPAAGWGEFSGWLEARHDRIRVTDAGSTSALAGLVMALVVVSRFSRRRTDPPAWPRRDSPGT